MGMLKYIADKLYSNNKEVALVENQLGIGQTWQNMISARAEGVVYTNDTSKHIMVVVSSVINVVGTSGSQMKGFIDGLEIARALSTGSVGATSCISILVPPNSTYNFNIVVPTSGAIVVWTELRGV